MSADLVFHYLVSPNFVRGAGMTLLLTIASLFFGIVIGLILALIQESQTRIGRIFTLTYLWLFRGTPVLVQLLFWNFIAALYPTIDIGPIHADANTLITPLLAAILGLALNEAAYLSEILRAGILAVPKGQTEAAFSLGLGRWRTFRLVVMPQAFRSVIPPMMSVFIALLKNTTVAAGFSVVNLGSIRNYLSERGANQFVVILWVMVIFVALVLLLSWAQRALENRWKVAR